MTHAVPPRTASPEVALAELKVGDRAVVLRLRDSHESLGDEVHSTLAQRLLELGFIPGEPVEVVGSIWPGADPIAVRLGRSLFALRRREAAAVLVTREGASS
ncbi:MAG: ferrous iron transport protein A [Steroidobacteraceae bacterium]|jgi:ferrous iron transport protein A|nr:ferrous iron transport protein A [Steroidobacteraceae bacterium]